jgi:hypothetical protein
MGAGILEGETLRETAKLAAWGYESDRAQGEGGLREWPRRAGCQDFSYSVFQIADAQKIPVGGKKRPNADARPIAVSSLSPALDAFPKPAISPKWVMRQEMIM